MKKILLISCSVNKHSPRGSISGCGLDFFKKEHLKKYPDDQIIERDLNDHEFLKESLTAHSLANWYDKHSDLLIDELKAADKLIIATSTINYNYPGLLKNYLDKICVAGKTFSYKLSKDPQKPGLLNHLKAGFIIAQGSPYEKDSACALDKNLAAVLNFLGMNVVGTVMIDGTSLPDHAKKTREEMVALFHDEIIDLVKKMN
ncbi:MAG: FMN-dependent NADH-azoreductase [Mycoplasmoidaceae bacterium]